ncbi:MAG: ATP-dependent Clp protease ATP-binding subunit ClpX [Lachnospiraceae bacterium]|nr:ATP-dependent Clp protease ATP-binding subunit ClpX [Lachnospiraceae bacterium]
MAEDKNNNIDDKEKKLNGFVDDTTDSDESDDGDYEKVCFVCRRNERTAGRMISMPGGIDVCSDCLQKAFNTFGNMDPSMLPPEMQGMTGAPWMTGIPGMTGMPGGFTNSAAKASEDDSEDASKGDGRKSGQGIPNLSFINLGDLTGFGREIPKRQKVKKKKDDVKEVFDRNKVPAPHKLKAMLDEYVVGQEKAKKAISVAIYNHYKRVGSDNKDGIEIEKSNMLLLGPTGSGKTYLVKTIAKLLDVPLAIADATSLTEAGYIGDDIESVVSKLLAEADNDVEKAEHGIIYIDEIDKIAKKKNTNTRDVSGESVQQELLKMLEGSVVEVPVGSNSKNAMVPMATVDTTNILFICGGAFPGLEEIIKERLNEKSSIGFEADLKDKHDEDKNLLTKAKVDDLRKFGMIPEFLGRLPIIVSLETLTKDFLVRILTEPKNAILSQYKKLLAMDEVQLEFSEGALEAIAEKAMEKNTGARALRSILEEFMLDIMYEIPKDDNIGRVVITKEYIENTGGPIIEMRGMETTALPQKD